jgi:hypothetical protein
LIMMPSLNFPLGIFLLRIESQREIFLRDGV